MNNIQQMIASISLTLLSTMPTFAKTDVSLRAEGGVSGYGGAILYHAHPVVGLVLGYNGGGIRWKNQLSIMGAQADLKIENDVSYMNANIYPWGKSENRWINSLYASIGIGYVDSKYNVHRNFKPGEKLPGKLNSLFFLKDKTINARGYIDYASGISPYLGFGFSPQFNEHWGAFTEFGVYYVGDATAHVTHINNMNLGFVPQKFTEYKLESNNLIAWSPVAKMGLSYRF